MILEHIRRKAGSENGVLENNSSFIAILSSRENFDKVGTSASRNLEINQVFGNQRFRASLEIVKE